MRVHDFTGDERFWQRLYGSTIGADTEMHPHGTSIASRLELQGQREKSFFYWSDSSE